MAGLVETVVPLLVAAACIAAPTVFFLGLFRLLDALRDDALIARVERREGVDLSSVAVTVPPTSRASTSGSRVRCPACGTENAADATYCAGCLDELPG